MAPAIVENPTRQTPAPKSLKGPSDYKDSSSVASGPKYYNDEAERNGTNGYHKAKYPNYLPTWDFSVTYPPIEPFEHIEHGKDADPSFPDLLPPGSRVDDMTANVGAEVHGVQLSQLTDKGKDQLSLFVSQKRVVAFRDQDWADLPIDKALDFCRYFGKLHIHPTSPCPAGYPEIHIVHRAAGGTTSAMFEDRLTSVAWHSDTSYEVQPPGITFLYMLDGPPAGGDTIFSDQVTAYNRLSPEFKKRLHGLKAYHTAGDQATMSAANGGVVRRPPVDTIHPVVRTHPTTGEKALWVNPQFTRRIVGFKKEESDMLLKFLFDHVAQGLDFQARAKWAPGTVVVWDNRICQHTAITDFYKGERRHIARITPQAERPYETPYEE